MLVDLDELSSRHDLSADICIIGSGAAGITLAREFAGGAHSVIVLEGGGKTHEAASQEPYRSSVVGKRHTGIHAGRARVLGGTTTLWAGQVLPLQPIDFEPRDWVPHSGWPIEYASLLPYYERAESVMQVPHAGYGAQDWPVGEKPPDYDADAITPFYTQFTSVPSFSGKYGGDLAGAPNVTVLTHANATKLEVSESAAAVTAVAARSFAGRSIEVKAKYYIVCCGAIDTARLLLASDSVEKSGVGNSRDVVGRYFMDHTGLALPIRPASLPQFQRWYNSVRRSGIRFALGMRTSPELQRRRRILNISSAVFYPETEDNPVAAAKRLASALKGARFDDIRKELPVVARRPHRVANALYRYYVLKQPASVGSSDPELGVGGEQCPNPLSRVTLGQEADSLGMRRTVLDWQLTDLDLQSLAVFAEVISEQWRRLEIGAVDLTKAQALAQEGPHTSAVIDSAHHMGTARMGADPRDSVVDERCRVHGYANLYIGSSAVFPTSGCSNPTLTIIALCLRMADELKRELGRSAPAVH